ncbi:MAG TPA: hypothetical protein VHX90_07615 [Verrucomicrobiae bacterium]|nr:hypothetical protein [Verrucomicrobiae bacterium]
MSRSEKIKKLANAIREFRGCKQGDVWVRSPRPHSGIRVVNYLAALGFDREKQMAEFNRIVGFKSFDELNGWLRDLDKPSPLSTAAVMGGAA